MKRSTGWCVVCGLVVALTGRALGQDKLHDVGKGGLKIEGRVDGTDPKVKIRRDDLDFKFDSDLPGKTYQVKMAAGQSYRIDMISDHIDSFLVIQDDKGTQLAFDDDSGGNLNARLYFTPPKGGNYKISAASQKRTGKFTLIIAHAKLKILEVGKGLKIEGKLGGAKSSIVYHVKMIEGKTYVINMLSRDQKALDPFLRLLDSIGKVLAVDDDGGEGRNARITIRAPASGTYQIVATSFGASIGFGGKGDFTLEVKEKDDL